MTITTTRPKAGALGLHAQNPHGSVRLSLASHGLLTLEPTSGGLEICSPTGRLWLTQEGDGVDHILEPGSEFRTTHPGRVVVEALEASTFSVCDAER